MASVPARASTSVINTLDPQPALPSVPAVIILETTANQLTVMPEAQHAMQRATREPTDSDPYEPPILSDSSLPNFQGIEIVPHSPALLRPPVLIVNTGRNEL